MARTGFWRRTGRGLGRHGPVLVAVAVSVLVATAVLAAVAGLSRSAATTGVRQRLAADAGRSVEVTARWTAPGLPAADRAVRAALLRTMDGTPFRTETALRAVGPVDLPLPSAGRRWAGETALSVLPVALPDPGRHGRLRSGSWPDAAAAPVAPGAPAAASAAELRVALPDTAADRLGLDSGGSTVIGSPGTGEPLRITVTGVYRPDPAAAAVWTALGGADGDGAVLMLVDGARLTTLPSFATRTLAVWLALPDTGGSSLSGLAALRDRTAVLAGSDAARSVYRGAEPALAGTTVRSGLPAAVDSQAVPALTARAEIAVPFALLALLAATVLVLTARRLADAVTGEQALRSSRGAGAVRLLAGAAGLWAVAALPAAVCGLLLADPLLAAVLRGAGVHGLAAGEGRAAWWVAGFALLVHGAALLLPLARQAVRRGAGRARGRGPRRLGLQRAGADLALLAVAALCFFQLRYYGGVVAGGPVAGLESWVDPTLVLAPAAMAVAGAVLLLRLLPPAGRLLERAAARGRGLVLPLAAWRLSRDTGRQAVPALVTLLAVACGALAAGTLGALPAGDRDRAAHAVGADLRLTAVPGPPARHRAALAALPGVTGAVPVAEQAAYLGTTVVQTIALNTAAASAADLPVLRPDLADRPVRALLAPLTAVASQGIVLPGEPTALEVTARASVDRPLPAPGAGLRFWLRDADGITEQLTVPLPADGSPHTLTVPLDDGGRRTHPLTIGRLGVHFPGGQDTRATLDLGVSRIAAVSGGRRTELALPPGQSWARYGRFPADPFALGCPGFETARPRSAEPPFDSAEQADVCTWESGGPVLLHAVLRSERPRIPPDAAGSDAVLAVLPGTGTAVPSGPSPAPLPPVLPALADRALLDAVGARVGDTVRLDWERDNRSAQPVLITGEVDGLPGYAGNRAHLVLDLRALAANRAFAGAAPPAVGRWWLTSDDPAATWAAVDGRGEFGRPQSVPAEAAALADDPFRAGLRCAWLLVLVTAPLFALAALTLHTVGALRARRRELAVLRALGVRRGELVALLRAEQAAVAVPPVLLGGVLGLLLATLLLTLTVLDDHAAPVFPGLLAAPGRPAAVLTALAVGLLLVLVLPVLTRLSARVDLVPALRAGEDG
ncbi:FtsX-like permease family protein [Kitasatospora sp. NPDC056327]|uniref:FtsX-like permease family protein n=1 Tax=Kitasatospora sp. NPDC056327 TaxID=3345785 RepID=UPI0035DF3BF6